MVQYDGGRWMDQFEKVVPGLNDTPIPVEEGGVSEDIQLGSFGPHPDYTEVADHSTCFCQGESTCKSRFDNGICRGKAFVSAVKVKKTKAFLRIKRNCHNTY